MQTIIIHPYLKAQDHSDLRTSENKLEEAVGLAAAINLNIKLSQVVALQKIVPATYIGKGKAEEFAEYIANNEIGLAIINTHITPVQQRNLETRFNCKVIDRTALILEIFGKRAQTKEGSLQVELAAQEYQKSRLVRSWTHLERQRGGAGFLGGPGETQIESDRRVIRDRISSIKKQLKKVEQTRDLHRKSRKKIPYKVVSLVGYTNAGKSTLFNCVTGAKVVAEDKLFATLDPTMRLVKLPSGKKIILSDTVGFISNLPTELVAAFRATLEEVVEADLMIHVRDISHPETEEQKKDVLNILSSLVVEDKIEHNMLEIFNKIDQLDGDDYVQIAKSKKDTAAISALTGQGVDYLLNLIDIKLSEGNREITVNIPVENGKLLAWIHANSKVLECIEEAGVMNLKLSMSDKIFGQFEKMKG